MAGRSRRTRVSGPASPLGRRILDAIDDGVQRRWEPALARAATTTGDASDRVTEVAQTFRTELGASGAAAGGAAAIPGVGLATTSAAFALELGWSTVRLTDLILTIAAIHGHGGASVEERRLWVLSILTYGDAASTMVTRLVGQVRRAGRADAALSRPATTQIPAEALRQLNRTIGATIVAKYGTRRGAMALSRAIPFGIGAVLGYGLNSYVVKATARQAHAFFQDLPVTVDAIDVASRPL
jgi:hypothetical protein